MVSAMQPTLWHITISHYSEKARWALDYKSIPYRLRAPVPGAHIPVALWLTYGRHYTLPVLDLGGERIGDSTAIIAALEQRQPEPPLYPRAPRRASSSIPRASGRRRWGGRSGGGEGGWGGAGRSGPAPAAAGGARGGSAAPAVRRRLAAAPGTRCQRHPRSGVDAGRDNT